MNPVGSHRESDDDYCRVIVEFEPKYRIIDGSCGIQWVIQKRDGFRKSGAPRWTGVRYVRMRLVLIQLYRSFCEAEDPTVIALLEQLPERHPRWGANG